MGNHKEYFDLKLIERITWYDGMLCLEFKTKNKEQKKELSILDKLTILGE